MSVLETLHGFYPLKMNEKVKIFEKDNVIWHLAKKQQWDEVIDALESNSYHQKFSENLASFIK